MKKFLLLQCFLLLLVANTIAQDFNERYKNTLRGDMIIVGNTVLGTHPRNPFNNRGTTNNSLNLVWVDVDNDPTTFNSSSANVKDPNPGSSCARTVKRAYLYWGGCTWGKPKNVNTSKYNQVKFKVNNGAYNPIVGERVLDNRDAFIYRADVTDKMTGVAGTYTVADLQASTGWVEGGYSGGWTLFIVYEDLTKPVRNITLFDGFAEVDGLRSTKNILVSGFKTVATGPVKAKIAFAALEGEAPYDGDRLTLATNKTGPAGVLLQTSTRHWNNFFNSTITDENGENLDRNPASQNLLGFDAGIFDVPNNGNSVLGNDTTSATLRATSVSEYYNPFLFGFSIEVIAPNIVMEKRVFSADGKTDLTGNNNIQLGASLRYRIKFKNVGNDNATSLVIKDVLPKNLQDFDDTPANLKLPTGVTHTYNNATRELTFNVPNNLVKQGSAEQEITFGVKVVSSCNDWRDACSNIIENRASATYNGEVNPSPTPFKAGSFNTLFNACSGGVEGPSNFIVNTDFSKCVYKNELTLCEPTATLTAGSGFTTYTWEKIEGANKGPISGNSQSINVSQSGTYRVTKKKTGCATMIEEFKVLANTNDAKHPIADKIRSGELNGEIFICPDDASIYPQVYLCGDKSTLPLSINTPNAKRFVLQKLGACANMPTQKECLPARCTSWSNVTTTNGRNFQYTFSEAGDYRLEVTFDGECVSTYYFKITKNTLVTDYTYKDIVCNSKGSITVTKPAQGQGYEYALLKGTTTVTGFQSNPHFDIATQGSYQVLIRQVVPATSTKTIVPCIFQISKSGVFIKERQPKLTVTPIAIDCAGGKGGMTIQLTDEPYQKFNYVVKNTSTIPITEVYNSGATTTTQLTIPKGTFLAGTYMVELANSDGCVVNKTGIKLDDRPQLTLQATVLSPIMCGTGTIRITASGGTKGTSYAFRESGSLQNYYNYSGNYYDFPITTAGSYTFVVTDANGCTEQISTTIGQAPVPTLSVSHKVYDCGAKARITFTVSSTTTYSYEYSVDGGLTYKTASTIDNLLTGRTYTPTVRYTYGTVASCTIAGAPIVLPASNGTLIASAGVAKLVSCGTGANAGKALVHFTNVQGGQEPYRYSYHGGNTWTSTRESWLAPNTYHLVVEDDYGCRRDLQVVVKDKPATPNFTPSNITYDCQGRGTVSITPNQTGYVYSYSIDGGAATTTNQFKDLTPGVHTITVRYDDPSSTTPGLLLKEDFGKGAPYTTPPSGMTPAYTLVDPRYQRLDWNKYFVAGKRDIVTSVQTGWWQTSCTWPNDHTAPGDITSRYLAVDFGELIDEGAIFYEKDVKDVIPNQPIEFEMFGYNLVRSYTGGGCKLPVMIMEVVALDNAGNVVKQGGVDKVLGRIESQEIPNNGGNANAWFRFASDGAGVNTAITPIARVNPGNYTRLKIRIRTKWNTTACNDFAFDDVIVYQKPETCGFTYTYTVQIANNKAFGVDPSSEVVTQPKCHNEKGTYRIGLKNIVNNTYYVSKDGGAFVAETANPFVWNNITPGAHTLKIRGEQNNANCEITRNFTITAPTSMLLAVPDSVVVGCTNIPQTVATVTGGTPPYKYTLQYTGTGAEWELSSPNFTFTQTGVYIVKVKDANNCLVSGASINATPSKGITLTGTANAANNNYCTTGGTPAKVEVQVNVTGGGSNAPYSFQHNGTVVANNVNATTYIYNNLAVGTHTFTVIDKYGCKATYVAEIKRPMSVTTPDASLLTKEISCHPGAAGNAKISLQVKDGYTPYTYIVKNNAGGIVQNTTAMAGDTATYETSTPDTYTIEVKDAKGCTVSKQVVVAAKNNPTVGLTVANVGCYGANNGSLSVAPAGGKAPYTIYINNVNKGTQRTFANLAAGTYTVKVVDANSCEVSTSTTITQPSSALKAFAGVSELIGCEAAGANKDNAKVRVTNVSGGVAPYQYKFGGNYQSHSEGYLPAGTHTVSVKDNNGCEIHLRVTVPTRIPAPTGSSYTITGYDCNGNATIRFTGTPTTYDYTYEIGGKTATGTTATVTGLAPGTYTVTIKYKDGNPPASVILMQEDFGFGDPEPYPGVNTGLFTYYDPRVHPVGNPTEYTRAAYKDYAAPNRFATARMPFYPTNPNGNWREPFPGTTTGGNNDRYLYVDMALNTYGKVFLEKEVEIVPGNKIEFNYQIRSYNGPVSNWAGALVRPNMRIRIVEAANPSNVLGFIDSGAIPHDGAWHLISSRNLGTINPGNTISRVKIQFLNSEPSSNGNDFAIDDINVYQVPKSCEQDITKQVVIPGGRTFRASTATQTNVSCNGGTGKVTLKMENLNGGSYQISSVGGQPRSGAGFSTPTTAPTIEIDNLRAGTHSIVITHSGNCVLTHTVTITEPSVVSLTATITQQAMCSNNHQARVTLSASGGVGPYTYAYYVGGTLITGYQSSNIFTNVATGTATFKVKDKNGCEATLASNLTIPTPAKLSATVTATDCYTGANNGEVSLTIPTGNGGYKVKLNNNPEVTLASGVNTHKFSGLTQGSYTVTITDAYGCSTATHIDINPTLNVRVLVTNQSGCSAGKIEVVATGGTGVIEYAYEGGSTAKTAYSSTQRSYTIPTFTGGTQTWKVYVRSGRCEKIETVTIKQASAVSFSTETETPTCQGSATGKIVVKNITGDANYTVKYGKAGTPVIATYTGIASPTYTISNLAPGAYSVTVTDKYGCAVMQSVTLQDMPALTATVTVSATTGSCITAGQAVSLTLTMSNEAWTAYRAGGKSIYYSFNGGAWHPMTGNPFSIAPIAGVTEPGKTVKVYFSTRATGGTTTICTTSAMDYVVPRPLGGISVTTDIAKFEHNCTTAGTPYFTATVTINPGVGNPPFAYNVNGGPYTASTTARTHVFTGLIVGRTYTFGVRDGNGCETEYTADIYANVATPAMRIDGNGKPACSNTGAQGEVTFNINRSNTYGSAAGTTLNWTIYEKTPGAGLGTAITNGTIGMPAPGGSTAPIVHTVAPNKTYYMVISEGTCTWGSRDVEVKKLDPITATVSQTHTITCETNGTLDVLNTKGGGGTYTYKILPVTPGLTFTTPIATGSNRIQIIKDNIAMPALPIDPVAPYSFTVSVTVEDQYGCDKDLGAYTFTVLPAPKINKVTLNGCVNGSISLTIEPHAKHPATAGTSATGAALNNYEYSIDGGLDYQASPTFGNLVAGAYDLQIRDKATGCIATLTYTVTANLQASAELTKPLGCGAGGTAEITLKVDQGTGNYSYNVAVPTGAPAIPAGTITVAPYRQVLSGLTVAGTYTVTLTDTGAATGCNTFTKTIQVQAAERPQIETSVKSITCHGGNDGEIYVTEKNGTIGAFTYVVQAPIGVTIPSFDNVAKVQKGLKAGVYTLTVTANSCQSVYTVTLTDPTAVTLSATQVVTQQFSCDASGASQQATINVPNGAVTGGKAPYTIQFTYGTTTSTGNTFTVGNIAGGVVTITAIDSNGCSTQTAVTINPFEGLDPGQATVTVNTAGTCIAPESVTVSITAATGMPAINPSKLRYYKGGTQPTVAPGGGAPWQSSPQFTVAVGETHTFWVGHIDTGCVVKVIYISPDPNNFSITKPQIKNVTCKGNNDGTATFTLSNTVTAHNYNVNLVALGGVTPPTVPAVSGANPTFNIAGLRPATYTMTVRSANTGCVQTYTFSIEEATAALTASVTVRSITCASAPAHNDGEIAIENVSGGWGGYQYYVSTVAPTPTSSVWTSTNVFTGLTPATYHVAVRDNNGCAVTLSSTATLAPPTTITGTLSVTTQNCTPNSGVLSVLNVSGGEGRNYSYQLMKDGALQGGAQTSTQFTGLGAGTYRVIISDTWGCTASATQSVTLYDPIETNNIGAVITKQVTCDAVNPGATVSVTLQGGSNSLRYTLTNNAGGTPQISNTGVFTNVPAGVYKISIADLITGCATVTSANVDVTDAATVSFTYTTTAVTCHGDTNGRLVITVPGTQTQTDYILKVVGTGLNRSETVNTTPKDIAFDGLAAGVYTVTLTSSRNCTATATVVITEPRALVVSTTTVTTHFKCNANNDAQQAIVQVIAQGGTGTLTYNFEVFDGTSSSTSGWGNTTGVYSVTSNGTHTQTVVVYVRDANGCQTDTRANPLVIPPLKRITAINAVRTQQLSCNSNEQVTFTIVGGSNSGYRVEVTSSVASPSVQNLTPGVNTTSVTFSTAGYYEIKVTDLATDCYATVSYTVVDFKKLDATAVQTKPVKCVGGNDGEVTLTIKGYQGNFTYQVFDATTLATVGASVSVPASGVEPRETLIRGLAKGQYVIRIVETDSPFCTFTTTAVMVSAPATGITATPTTTDRIKCGTNQVGAFNVAASGGWGNYQYRLLVGTTPHSVYGTFTSTSLFEGLTSATYTVEVKDEQGCIETITHTMAPPALINATVSETNVKCFGYQTGIITVSNTTGGSGNYVYELWEVGGNIVRGAQTSTTFTGLDARSYNVKVIDGWGCDLTIPVTITEPDELKVMATIASPLTCQNQATISLTVTGGTPGYTYYQVTNGTLVPMTGTSIQVPAGEYEFVVKDANGCESKVSNKIVIYPVEALQLHVDETEAYVRCNGGSTARITFSATGGLGNYQYKLYKGGVLQGTATLTQISGTDWSFSGLNIGNYQVVVTSVDCVATSTNINILEADAIVVATASTDISCYGEKDGTISVTATGGTGKMLYSISPRFDRTVESGYFTNLERGEYIVRIQDANGCHTDEKFVIKEPAFLRVSIDKKTNEVCYGAADGTVSVTITGGTPSYTTSIDNGTTWNPNKTLYTGLASGTYTLMVKDVRSCTTEISVTIDEGVDLQATATVEYSCGNNTVKNDIRVSVKAQHAATTFYALDGGTSQANPLFANVTAGVHTVTVKHAGGCTQTLTVNVEAYNSLTATTATKTDMSCYATNDGTITFAVTGATSSYTYSIAPEAGTFDGVSKYTGLSAGTYTVKVKDNVIGCELSQNFTIVEPDLLLATANTVSETCYQANDGKIIFSIKGGKAPYSYTLRDEAGNTVSQANNVATGAIQTVTNVVGKYILEYADGSCSQTLVITVPSAPNLRVVGIKEMFNCSTVSTTYTTSYLQVEFENADGKLTASNTSYSLDGNTTYKKRFRWFDGNYGYTDDMPIGVHSITIHYVDVTECTYTYGNTFSITRYPGLEIKDKSDPREINKIKVIATGGNSATYTYYFNGFSDGTNEYMVRPTDPISRVVGNRVFRTVVVEVTDANGCSSTLTLEKESIKSVPPNFFTPNGDGQNDGWDPDPYRSYPDLSVDIYDRYGRYITSLRSGQKWDGRYNGKEMPSGDYWYILRTNEEGDDAQEYMGHFTLYRYEP